MDFEDPDDIAYYARQAVFYPEITKKRYPRDVHKVDYIQLMIHNFVLSYYESVEVHDAWEELYKLIPRRFLLLIDEEGFPTGLMVYVLHTFTSEQIAQIIENE